MKEMTNVTDTEGQPIGDIFEFVEDIYGRKCHFTHRLSALNWTVDDLLIIDKNYDIQNS